MATESANYTVASDGEVAMGEDPDRPAMPDFETIIGIDFGTSNCSVAVWKNGRVEVLANAQGHKRVPSHVLFSDSPSGLSTVGTATEDELWSGSAIFNVKRLIGRMDLDPIIQSSKESYPFLVESLGIGVRPFLGALGKDVWRATTPEEVLALQLMEMRAIAEAKLGRMVRTAVITVPVSFSRFQLTRFERACTMAGIQARLMPEPTSVVLVYAQMIQRQGMTGSTGSGSERVAMIYNMGAGYCDACITATAGGVSQIRGLAGDAFGGEELLQNLVHYLMTEMLPQLGQNPPKQRIAVATGRLRFAAERAMRALSTEPEAVVEVNIGDGQVFSRNVTRDVFEDINAAVFQRCLYLVVGCLKDAEVEPDTISDVIAVGGCANIPAVKSVLQKVFGTKKDILLFNQYQNVGIDPAEAALRGAALEGAIMSGLTDPSGSLDLLTIQAMPLSVGLGVAGGEFHPILRKNSTIPARKDVVVTTCHDNQRDALIAVYEGECKQVRENHLLGLFKLSGLTPAPKGVPLISVCMDIDASNVLRVVAGTCLLDSSEPAVQLREVRMPTVDDGHGWCVEAIWKQHGNSMDVTLPQQQPAAAVR